MTCGEKPATVLAVSVWRTVSQEGVSVCRLGPLPPIKPPVPAQGACSHAFSQAVLGHVNTLLWWLSFSTGASMRGHLCPGVLLLSLRLTLLVLEALSA